jgi:hypothetical protein
MIPIKNIRLKKISVEHVNNVLNYYQTKKAQLRAIDNWIGRIFGANYTLRDVLSASVQQLETFVNAFDNLRPRIPSSVLNIVNVYSNFATVRKTKFRESDGTKYSAYSLIHKLGITVCPYCNRNYIFNIPSSYKRTSQLDHFFNKKAYPFLSLSFYNLVPSCSVCNHLKLDIPGKYYNPYSTKISVDKLLKFSVKVKGVDYMDDEKDLEIETKHHPAFFANYTNLEIGNIYSKHKDLVQEIIKKRHIYNHSYISQLLKDYGGKVFKNREDLMTLILSNYITDEELAKRPFAKLTRDIWDQLQKDRTM